MMHSKQWRDRGLFVALKLQIISTFYGGGVDECILWLIFDQQKWHCQERMTDILRAKMTEFCPERTINLHVLDRITYTYLER
jgi:hypothetical protein